MLPFELAVPLFFPHFSHLKLMNKLCLPEIQEVFYISVQMFLLKKTAHIICIFQAYGLPSGDLCLLNVHI